MQKTKYFKCGRKIFNEAECLEIHNTLFSLQLQEMLSKLQCLSVASLTSLV